MKEKIFNENGCDVRVCEFSSIQEFITWQDELETPNSVFSSKAYPKTFETLSSHTGDKEFTDTKNYKEAKDLLESGWTIKAEEITTELNKSKLTIETFKQFYDVVGFQASVPRYLQGIPTSMVNRKKVTKKKKVITLNSYISYSANVSAETITKNSIEALKVVQAFESQGYRVNLNIFFGSHTNSSKKQIIILKVRIKSANERLNISKVAFPLVHPSMLRRIVFKFMEGWDLITDSSFEFGYGTPLDENNSGHKRIIKKCMEENEVWLPSRIHDAKVLIENGLGL